MFNNPQVPIVNASFALSGPLSFHAKPQNDDRDIRAMPLPIKTGLATFKVLCLANVV